MSLEEQLKELRERDQDKLDYQASELDKVYSSMPEILARTAALVGMPEEDVVSCAVSAAWQYKDIRWYQVIDILRSFYLAKGRLEAKRGQQ